MEAILAERCIGGSDLTEPRLSSDGSLLIYARSTGGVANLVVHRFDGSADEELAVLPALRPGRGLGGGAWTFSADGRAVIYVAADGNLWQQMIGGGAAIALTDHGPDRAASGPCPSSEGSDVVYVLDLAEVHTVDVSTGQTRRLDGGSADFCMDPFVDGLGVVRWMAWNVPNMAWDASRIQYGDLAGRPVPRTTDTPSRSCVQQPRVLPNGLSIAVRDDLGWLNVWVGDAPLVEEPFEHAGPSWGPGQRSYDWSPDGRFVAVARNEAGFGRLCVIEIGSGRVTEVARGVHGQLSWQGSRLAAIRTGACTPTQIVVYDTDTDTWARTTVEIGAASMWSPDELVEPELVEVPIGEGLLHGRLYRSRATDGRLIVWLHGGPTDQWMVTFMPRISYWLSRGWSILVPDHRGSTGHGRAYQQALRGRWGEQDVADTMAMVDFAATAGWAAPGRTVVFGSSAGGFTALGAIAADPGRFAAGVVLYPVSDLIELAEHSHRFERHYTDSLVGPLPESLALYRERSPAYHADQFAQTPILILHGEMDAVVPVRQSRVFAQRVRTAGGDAQLHVYPNEGHGFRHAANQLDEYRRAEDFLARCVPVASSP